MNQSVTSPTPDQKPPQHLGYLDAARGIAAIMVMVYHFINWKYDARTGAKVASMIFNGSDAVSFFFVLSGFVLSYKYVVSDQPLDLKKFYINRLFRLWPAYFITVLINALNVYRHDLNVKTLTDLFVLNKNYFWEEAFLLRGHPGYYVPGWTLVLELVMSFFLPFAIILAKKDKRIVYWMLLVYIVIGNSMRDLYIFHVHFLLGLALSCLYHQLSSASFKEIGWYRYRYLLLVVAFIFFSIRHIDRIWPFNATYTYIAGYFGISFFLYTGIASFVFIAAILCSRRAQYLLEHRLLRFFGKISYGIYLMHWLPVTDIFQYWDRIKQAFPNVYYAFFVSLAGYVCLTILLATILHYTIELPFIRLGKRITRKMKPSLVIQ
jgi:peptidoglycan/LPS O-acetylase OafA/YrhL